MADYTAWNNTLPTGTNATTTGSRNDGLYFTVTQDGCSLTGIAFYCAAGETNLTGSNYTATLYTTTTGTSGTQVAQANGTGTFTAGAWNWIDFNVPLSQSVYYVAAIHHPNNLQFESSWWSGRAAFDNGPLHIPTQPDVPGSKQQPNLSGATAFPSNANTPASWYGIDAKINVPDSTTGTGAVTLKKMTMLAIGGGIINGTGAVTLKKMTTTGSGFDSVHGTGAVTLKKMTMSASGIGAIFGTGGVTLKKMTASGSGTVNAGAVVGTGAVTLKKMTVSASSSQLNTVRRKLQTFLENLDPSVSVYFQPPPNIQMRYPAIVYNRDYFSAQFADNLPYATKFRWQITVIAADPDSPLHDELVSLPLTRYVRHYTTEQLNHDIYQVYF